MTIKIVPESITCNSLNRVISTVFSKLLVISIISNLGFDKEGTPGRETRGLSNGGGVVAILDAIK
jgi:hypothetical protein